MVRGSSYYVHTSITYVLLAVCYGGSFIFLRQFASLVKYTMPGDQGCESFSFVPELSTAFSRSEFSADHNDSTVPKMHSLTRGTIPTTTFLDILPNLS